MQSEAWSKASVRSAVILAFAYREAELAIIAMDAGSDTDFTTWFEEVGTELITQGAVDLSHNAGAATIQFVLTPEVAFEATGELLDAYDRLRASRGRGRPPELRETVQAMFKLRERLMDAEDAPTVAATEAGPAWLDWPLDRFPIPTATINKLRRADLYSLRQLHDEDKTRICGLTGLSEGQLEKLDELAWGYLCATTDVQERAGAKLLQALSELVGEPISIALHKMVAIAIWRSTKVCSAVLTGDGRFPVKNYADLIKRLVELERQLIPWNVVFAELDIYSLQEVQEVQARFTHTDVKYTAELLRCDEDLVEELCPNYLMRVEIERYCVNLLGLSDHHRLQRLLSVIDEPPRFRVIRPVQGDLRK